LTAKDTAENLANLEQALSELETIVERMEKGELTLEQSLAQFERGVTLARQCQEALKQAEQKVETLVSRGGSDSLEPLKPDE
jgi:exodeoxyribonuclease VII small subunit